jgi:aspartyl-tRNA(Asn)/glutamyl-tRNA(Gln) amidotransferase subunit B
MLSQWETVIGLEVHVQLATRSKIFSGAATRFGAAPNTQACAIDLAMPGTLPVLNREAVHMAVKFGLAIGADIARVSVFDRKNYFYPDLPKGYQISQLDHPIVGRGSVTVELPDGSSKCIGVTRAHLEEDAGKSLHEDFHGLTGIDLNRAGTPLLEIVSEPEIRSAQEAVAYLRQIHSIIRYLGISDGNMAEGSMRCDVNLSLRRHGQSEFGTRCEIKNVNSVRSLGRAIDYEARRQIDLLETGGSIRQETRHWDENDGRTHTLRSKEDADDYRYFLEPDLVPLVPSSEWIAAVKSALPMLPGARRARLSAAAAVASDSDAVMSVVERGQDDYVLAVAAAGGDIGRALVHVKEAFADEPATPRVPAADLAALTTLEVGGALTATQAKAVLAEIVANGGGDAAAIAAAKGFEAMDTGALEAMVDQAIADQPDAWAKFCAGEGKAMGALVGAVMKLSQGKADGKLVTALLNAKKG